ncbi:hypothetical protein ACFSMW_06640 [Virgibacillus halophilus]|uniref:Uncharacterized protein n=1 Tax=Tigheibacillus halophilus TaxID=361280 RepID=A0ABU5C634_9BACI|nr:hypothetical protein [Virgibacillus halophilus]
MIIYEAYINGGDYYNPIQEVGIYNDFEIAKKEVESASEYIEELYVNVLELKGNRFEITERWSLDKNDKNSIWKKEE